MAASIRDHIHIDTDNPPTATYAAAEGTWDHTPTAPMALDYAINGTVHVHRLLDDVGAIILYEDTQITVICVLAEMLVLRALASSTVYFVSNYHDDTEGGGALDVWPTSDYVVRATLKLGNVTNIDPMGAYWRISFQFADIQAGP